MKKILGLGIIIAASPIAFVVACGNNNDTQKNGNDDSGIKYKPLRVETLLKNLSDEDMWVYSSVTNYDYYDIKDISKFRDDISFFSKQDENEGMIAPHVSQKDYDKILNLGHRALIAKNFWAKLPESKLELSDRNDLNIMKIYYEHFKKSSIKSKINTKTKSGNDIVTMQWL